MNNFSPAIEQCESIIDLTEQKKILFLLKIKCDEIMEKFTEDEKDCLDYKYFKKKPKSYYVDFDFTSRAYFRKQNRIIKKFSLLLEKKGISDEFINKKCFLIDFIKEVYLRVKIREEAIAKKEKKDEKVKYVKRLDKSA